jgi:hypothetical protein
MKTDRELRQILELGEDELNKIAERQGIDGRPEVLVDLTLRDLARLATIYE